MSTASRHLPAFPPAPSPPTVRFAHGTAPHLLHHFEPVLPAAQRGRPLQLLLQLPVAEQELLALLRQHLEVLLQSLLVLLAELRRLCCAGQAHFVQARLLAPREDFVLEPAALLL